MGNSKTSAKQRKRGKNATGIPCAHSAAAREDKIDKGWPKMGPAGGEKEIKESGITGLVFIRRS